MEPRRLDVFFYGLFMDDRLLVSKGIHPTDIRPASVSGLALRIGARAALVAAPGHAVHGILMKLTHADLDRLYAEPGVQVYRPEPVLAQARDGATVAALCYNLPEAPAPDQRNDEYVAKLRSLAQHLGLPDEYVASIK